MKRLVLLLLLFISFCSFGQDKLFINQGNPYGGDTNYDYDAIAYRNRVWADGGIVISMSYVDSTIKMLKWSGAWQNVVEVYSYKGGVKKDGSNLVSTLYGFKGKDLTASGTERPTRTDTGIYFDGGNDRLQNQFTWNYIQPEFIFMVFKQVSWTLNDYITDGGIINSVIIYQSATSPGLKVTSGTASAQNSNLGINTFAITRILFNGASSSFQIATTAALTGNYGALNMSGITIGGRYSGGQNSNINVKDIILGNTAWNATIQGYIYNYLKVKNGL